MEYRPLGRTALKISAVGLGTMTFGEQNSEADAHEQLEYAFEAGINFIDAAEMYPVPPKAETYGRTEEYIGTWLKQRNRRHEVILATKAASRATDLPWIRNGNPRLNADHLGLALAAKIRYIGVSNDTPWGLMHILHLAAELNLARVVSIQNPYNLLNRTFEIGLAEIAHREGIGLLAYSPLGFGVLSGKYLGGARPADARLT